MEVELIIKEDECRIESCERRWEDLPMEILTNIFKRLDVWDLIFLVPLVCRWWSSASMDPTCWMVLDLRLYANYYYDNVFEGNNRIRNYEYHVREVIRAAVNRAGKHILHLIFPCNYHFSDELLIYISERSPRLKRLVLPSFPEIDGTSKVLRNWSQLEAISGWFPIRGRGYSHVNLKDILDQIGVNCKKLTELRLHGEIHGPDAIAIATNIPKLEFLDISMSNLSQVALSYLLENCRQLKHLNISHCNQVEEANILHFPEYHERNIFDSDLIQAAASLLDICYCSRQIDDFCEMCNFVESKPYWSCLYEVWMLGELGYACDMKILIHDKFIPFYIVAVLTDDKPRFYHYFNTWIRRENKIQYQKLYPELFQKRKDMEKKNMKMELKKMEMTKKSYPCCGIM
ncbi:hypothetical protein AQUCO_02700417v1 [Aquilegia coerulea]|uniref:F-box domain-containing protein n=1 Tax=Aquilegia coerulea TaxID=218851 RepID=A0A2G5D6S7_AQUCA|nr:hypothetical protein AQUCO_02700417v1 [Aquilegia coerulea]